MPKKRKTPVKHKVKSHKRKDTFVHNYVRGSGSRGKGIANPRIKRKTLTDTRIQSKINDLKRLRNVASEQDSDTMEKYYQTQIDVLKRFLGKTRTQIKSEILLLGDELLSARFSNYNFDYIYRLEQAFKLAQKITGIKYPKLKYVLAEGVVQDAYIVGYKPKSEKLVWMSPDKFLSFAGTALSYDKESIEKLQRKMQGGKPLDALWLDVDVYTKHVKSHEGRHRAKVAKALGIKKVPVVLYAKDGYEWEDAKNLPKVEQLVREGR